MTVHQCGHPLSAENTYTYRNRGYCRTCRNARQARWRAEHAKPSQGNPAAKLSPFDRWCVAVLRATGLYTLQELADTFGVTRKSIQRCCWAHWEVAAYGRLDGPLLPDRRPLADR